MRPWIEGLEKRGFQAEALALPFGPAERAVPRFLAEAGPDVVIGGQSFGGRVATMAAAQAGYRGVVCFCYPLSGRTEARTGHWPAIACPVLIVNGEEDLLADPAQLGAQAPLLRRGTVHLLPGLGHDLSPRREHVLDLVAAFAATLDEP